MKKTMAEKWIGRKIPIRLAEDTSQFVEIIDYDKDTKTYTIKAPNGSIERGLERDKINGDCVYIKKGSAHSYLKTVKAEKYFAGGQNDNPRNE